MYSKNPKITGYESIKTIVGNFISQRNKNQYNEDFLVLNKNSLLSYKFELDDKDYYIEVLGCLICKSVLKNYASLVLHYKHNHIEFIFFNVKQHNSHTNLKEAHIIAISLPQNIIENEKSLSCNNDIISKIKQVEFGFFLNEHEKEILVVKSLEDKSELKFLGLLNNDASNSNSNTKKPLLQNSNKQIFKAYPYNTNSLINNELVLYDVIGGEFISNKQNCFVHEKKTNYKYFNQELLIDNTCKELETIDIYFFKLWNRVIHEEK
jgi:hypothetical protein